MSVEFLHTKKNVESAPTFNEMKSALEIVKNIRQVIQVKRFF